MKAARCEEHSVALTQRLVQGPAPVRARRSCSDCHLAATPPGEPIVVDVLDALNGNKKAMRWRILDLVCQTNALGIYGFATVKYRLPIPCPFPRLSNTTHPIVCTPFVSVVVSSW